MNMAINSHSESSLQETLLQSETLYEGRILNLRVDEVTTPAGNTAKRECIEHAPAVTILPFEPPDTLYLIRQYRHATGEVLIEAPAGCIDASEAPLVAAKRELREETGFVARQWHPLCEAYMAPGFCDEYMTFFLATSLTKGATHFDEDETIELFSLSVIEMESYIRDGKIRDAKTLLAYAYAKPIIHERF